LHVMLQGAVPPEIIAQMPEAISAGFPSFKIFTTDVRPQGKGRMIRLGHLWAIMEASSRHGGILAIHAEDDDLVMYMYERLEREEDRQRLWTGLLDGSLATVATDELCTPRAIKLRSRHVADATGGHVGVETRVPIIYTEGVSKRGMSLERFVAVTSTNAAKILGLYPKK